MRKIILFLNSLEKRERLLLIIGIYAVIIIIGIFFITLPLYNSNKKLENILETEISKFNELKELASKYQGTAKNKIEKLNISLSEIENLSMQVGIKDKISSIKPITFGEEKGIEINIKGADYQKVFEFLVKIKKKGYSIKSISINDPKGNGKLNVKLVVGA